MGCDIHTVIEYKKWDLELDWDWFAEIDLPRDYALFSAIAFGEGGVTDDLPYPLRGLPHNVSLKTHELFYMGAQEYKDLMAEFGIEEDIDLESMADWERTAYLSTGAVRGPDWHTPGWLNVTELLEALEKGGIISEKQSPEVKAMLSAMKILVENYGVENVRFVFWFDG